MRQLFRNFPPRMASRKCTCQLSLELALPIEAAQPPSAITVCALPNNDLQITATRRPCCRASIAARRPEPPAPITSTSYACRSTSVIDSQSLSRASEDPHVRDPPGGHQPDVQVGQRDPHQRRPGQLHVVAVEEGNLLPELVAQRGLREGLELATHDV